MNKKLGVAAVFAALGTFMSLGITPALAVTNSLPASNSLYTIDALGTGVYETTSSGAQTRLTLQLNDDTFGSFPAGAFNPIDHRAYIVFAHAVGSCGIDSIDLLGGAPHARVPVTNHDTTLIRCYGFDIDPAGNAWISATDSLHSVYAIWKLNLLTGAATDRVVVPEELFGFTVAPDGTWFGIKANGNLVRIDSTSGAFTTMVSTTLLDTYDITTDSASTVWFTDQEGSAPFQLYSWRNPDTGYTMQGDLSVGGLTGAGVFGPIFVGLSTPAISALAQSPSLADTGVDPSLQAGVITLGAGLVVAGMATLVYSRRRFSKG